MTWMQTDTFSEVASSGHAQLEDDNRLASVSLAVLAAAIHEQQQH